MGGEAPPTGGGPAIARRPPQLQTPKSPGAAATRTAKKRPLECYVCAYKSETPLRACLDPTKFRCNIIKKLFPTYLYDDREGLQMKRVLKKMVT